MSNSYRMSIADWALAMHTIDDMRGQTEASVAVLDCRFAVLIRRPFDEVRDQCKEALHDLGWEFYQTDSPHSFWAFYRTKAADGEPYWVGPLFGGKMRDVLTDG